MSRFLTFVVIFTSFGVAHAQQDGGNGGAGGTGAGGAGAGGTGTGTDTGTTGDVTGGELDTTEIVERGIETGPTEQTESGFAGPEESGFEPPGGGRTFRARTFNSGGQTREIVTGGTSQTQRQIRPTFRLGFVPSATMLARSRQRAVSRWVTITPRATEIRGMSFNPDQNGRVTVRGQATSRYGSLLAAAIARLEPGVRSVRNEVQIVPDAGAASQLQQPSIPQPQPGIPQPQLGIPQPVAPARSIPFAPGIQIPTNPAPTVPNPAPVQNQTPSTAPIVLPLPPLAPRR